MTIPTRCEAAGSAGAGEYRTNRASRGSSLDKPCLGVYPTMAPAIRPQAKLMAPLLARAWIGWWSRSTLDCAWTDRKGQS